MHHRLTQWWNGISLRTKITGVIVLLLTLGLLVAGAGTLSLLNAYLLGEVDNRVASGAREFEEIAESSDDYLRVGQDECFVSAGPVEEFYIAVVDADGRVLCDNTNGTRADPDLSMLDSGEVRALGGTVFTVSGSTALDQWRVIAASGRSAASGAEFSVVLGLELESTNQTVSRFAAIFMFFAIAVIVLGGALTRLLVMTTFAPLRDVEETAARFADGDFSQRMSGALPNTEVGRLNRSLNAMLARIDRAFADRAKTIDQMRRFVGDASHELRTPLVSVRGYAELYRMGALATDQDVAQAMDRIEKEAIRMGALVSDLLELARLDEARQLTLAPVDLVPIAQDAALDATASAPDRVVTVVELEATGATEGAEAATSTTAAAVAAETPADASRPRAGTLATAPIAFSRAQLARLRNRRTRAGRAAEPEQTPVLHAPPPELRAIVRADENKIRQVVTNLMGNAMRFSPPGTPIEIGVGVDPARGVGIVAIIDHGEGIPPQLREKIFQRFYRADSSRTRDTGGSGLGLAIVSAIVQSHNGRVEVDETPGGGATFRVLLPLLPSDDASPVDASAGSATPRTPTVAS